MIQVKAVSKSYNGRKVLDRFTMQLEEGGIYCLMGASGIGKTTLLRILMGLEQPDGVDESRTMVHKRPGRAEESRIAAQKNVPETGRISGLEHKRISAVFQENRLCEYADAVKNIRLAAGRDGLLTEPEKILDGLLEPEAWHRPVGELSGGMQRRVAVLRALAVKSDFLIMDEPFTGLDTETKDKLIAAVLEYRSGRTLLVVSHQEEDAHLLGAEIIRIS